MYPVAAHHVRSWVKLNMYIISVHLMIHMYIRILSLC